MSLKIKVKKNEKRNISNAWPEIELKCFYIRQRNLYAHNSKKHLIFDLFIFELTKNYIFIKSLSYVRRCTCTFKYVILLNIYVIVRKVGRQTVNVWIWFFIFVICQHLFRFFLSSIIKLFLFKLGVSLIIISFLVQYFLITLCYPCRQRCLCLNFLILFRH